MAAALLQWPIVPTALAGALPGDRPSSHQETRLELPAVTAQPDLGPDVRQYFNDPAADPELAPQVLVKLLQKRIKYVFVIFNENHSFDNEYGTFPGVNGLYSDGLKPRPPTKPRFHPDLHRRHTVNRHGAAVPDRARAELEHR